MALRKVLWNAVTARTELGADTLSETRGAEAVDQLMGILLTVLEGCALLILEKGVGMGGRGNKEGDRSMKPLKKVLLPISDQQQHNHVPYMALYTCCAFKYPYPKFLPIARHAACMILYTFLSILTQNACLILSTSSLTAEVSILSLNSRLYAVSRI
jgi:hypothetical protein